MFHVLFHLILHYRALNPILGTIKLCLWPCKGIAAAVTAAFAAAKDAAPAVDDLDEAPLAAHLHHLHLDDCVYCVGIAWAWGNICLSMSFAIVGDFPKFWNPSGMHSVGFSEQQDFKAFLFRSSIL